MSDKKYKIIEKIRKLMIHERSARAIGNLDEAKVYADRIGKLREKHLITGVIQLEEAEETHQFDAVFDDKSPLFKRKRVLWEEILFTAVCKFHEVRPVIFKGTNLKIMYGEKENRDKCREDFLFLYEIAVNQSFDFIEKSKEKFVIETKLWKQSYLLGFANGIGNRLNNILEKRAYVKNKRAARNTEQSTAAQLAQDPNEQLQTALAVTEKPVYRPPSENRQKIEEKLNNLKNATSSITEVEGQPYYAGMKTANDCEFSGNLAITENSVNEEYEASRPRTFLDLLAGMDFVFTVGSNEKNPRYSQTNFFD